MFISLSQWQTIVEQLQALAARYPEMGINPDSVPIMSIDDLIGNYHFLNQYHADNGGE